MTKDKVCINTFIKHIFDENFAEAKADLQSAVSEKLKIRMKDDVQSDNKENQ